MGNDKLPPAPASAPHSQISNEPHQGLGILAFPTAVAESFSAARKILKYFCGNLRNSKDVAEPNLNEWRREGPRDRH